MELNNKMFITIKGNIGKYNAIVTGFYKDNLSYLKRRIPTIYNREYDMLIPSEFHDITTIKDLKAFVKEHMDDMDNYPFGFKHIDGVYCLYECIG